jgi:hypothetical protein
MHRFVVGTGRCGSTLLSRMLAECPEVLSLFEFFNGLDMARRLDPSPIDGPAYAALIGAEQPFVTAVLRRGYRVEEITYPFADDPARPGGPPRGRLRSDDRLPWLLVSLLPRLSDDPDALFDALLDHAHSGGTMPARDHHLRVFDWLAARDGRSAWIERSGSSIDYAAELIAAFPEARFVHIHRSGPEVALSMREHHAYRLPISLLYDAPLCGGDRVSTLPPLDFEAEPTPDDTISRILAARPSAEYFGRYWSDQIGRGKPALDALPEDRLLEVAFEDLMRRPAEVLDAIARFFALGAPGPARETWTARAAALVRGAPRARLPGLSAGERSRLLEACAPGQAALGPTARVG